MTTPEPTYVVPPPDPAASRPGAGEVPRRPDSAATLRALTEWASRAAWPLGPWPDRPGLLVATQDMALWPYRWAGGPYPPVPGATPPAFMATAEHRLAAAEAAEADRFWYPITLLAAAHEVARFERRWLAWPGELEYVRADPVAAGNRFGGNVDSAALWEWGWGRNALPDAATHVARRDAERAIQTNESAALATAQSIHDWMLWDWPEDARAITPAAERPSPDYRR